MLTCPLNLDAFNTNPEKHIYAGRKNGRLLNGSDFLIKLEGVCEEENRYHKFPGSETLEDYFENNEEVVSMSSVYVDTNDEKSRNHHIIIGFNTNIYQDDINTSVIIRIPLELQKYVDNPSNYIYNLMNDIVECFENDPTSDIKRNGITIRYAKTY